MYVFVSSVYIRSLYHLCPFPVCFIVVFVVFRVFRFGALLFVLCLSVYFFRSPLFLFPRSCLVSLFCFVFACICVMFMLMYPCCSCVSVCVMCARVCVCVFFVCF